MSQPDIETAREQAHDYLRAQLADRAPVELHYEGTFDERPLESEGRTTLFSFDLHTGDASAATCPPAQRRHYVAVGRTQPNFFPGYDLDPDQAYSFHLGTQFMLEMGVRVVDSGNEPPNARPAMRQFVQAYAQGAPIEDEQLAGLFRCDDDYFAVYRLKLAGEDVYCMGAACPPGFYRMTRHPPQAALRLHLGNAIRAEARMARERGDESPPIDDMHDTTADAAPDETT